MANKESCTTHRRRWERSSVIPPRHNSTHDIKQQSAPQHKGRNNPASATAGRCWISQPHQEKEQRRAEYRRKHAGQLYEFPSLGRLLSHHDIFDGHGSRRSGRCSRDRGDHKRRATSRASLRSASVFFGDADSPLTARTDDLNRHVRPRVGVTSLGQRPIRSTVALSYEGDHATAKIKQG
jgi:hypothetical protein